MSGPDIHNYTGGLHTSETYTPSPVDEETPHTTPSSSSHSSTLSISEQQAMEILINAAFPAPAPPNNNTNVDSTTTANISLVVFDAAKKLRQITKSMMDGWIESIRKEREYIEKKLNSPDYQAWKKAQSPDFFARIQAAGDPINQQIAVLQSPEYQAFLAQLTPIVRSQQIEAGDSYKAIAGLERRADSVAGVLAFMAPTAMMISAVPGGTLVSSVQMTQGIEPGGGVFRQLAQAVSVVIPDINVAALGLIGALFTVGLNNVTLADSVGKSLNTGKEIVDLPFAKKYAKNLLDFFKIDGMDARFKEIFGEKGATVAKIAMLSMAMALIYSLETGWKVGGQEFRDMLAGKMNFPPDDVRNDLSAALRQLLATLPPNEQKSLVDAMANYFTSKPNIQKELMDSVHFVKKALQKISDRGPILA